MNVGAAEATVEDHLNRMIDLMKRGARVSLDGIPDDPTFLSSHIGGEASKAIAERISSAICGGTAMKREEELTVSVRRLEWRENPNSFPSPTWNAQTPFGFFNIEEVSASDAPAYEVRLHARHLVAIKDSLAEAKKAAHADYEARIRSALLTTPKPEAEPYGFAFQHEETGLQQVIDVQQVEWGFEEKNPRWQKIGPVYLHPPEPEVAEMMEHSNRLQRLFDQQWKRTREAGELWRQAHPGNDDVSPDLGELVTWLMARAVPHTTEGRVTVAYAYCCCGSTKYCDCVNPNHGTALMHRNEAGDDYPIVSEATEGGAHEKAGTKHHIGKSLENDCWFVRYYPFKDRIEAESYVGSVSELTRHCESAASLLETLSDDLPDDDVSGIMMRVMAQNIRKAIGGHADD